MNKKSLASYLDFANHQQEATPEDIRKLCQAVKKYGFHSAFVNPCYVALAKSLVGGGKVGTVIAFPLGQEKSEIKVAAALEAVGDGADELDVSMNVGLFKAGNSSKVLEEMKMIVKAVKGQNPQVLIKFIIETGLLTTEEIKKATELVLESKADFVKTSSGLGPRGATLEDVELIKQVVGEKLRIKVAGGVDTWEEAMAFIKKGVSRIGTSHAPAIIRR